MRLLQQVQDARWKAIKENPNARPIRTNPNPQIKNPPTKQNFQGLTIDKTRPGVKLPRSVRGLKSLSKAAKIPLIGGLTVTGLSLLEGANPLEAAAAGLDAENPISGGAFGDGSLQGAERTRLQIQQRDQQAEARQALIKKDPSQERGYETIQRVGGQVMNAIGGWMSKLGIQ